MGRTGGTTPIGLHSVHERRVFTSGWRNLFVWSIVSYRLWKLQLCPTNKESLPLGRERINTELFERSLFLRDHEIPILVGIVGQVLDAENAALLIMRRVVRSYLQKVCVNRQVKVSQARGDKLEEVLFIQPTSSVIPREARTKTPCIFALPTKKEPSTPCSPCGHGRDGTERRGSTSSTSSCRTRFRTSGWRSAST